MWKGSKLVKNVLMTCAAVDGGFGGVQLVFGDLVHWLEESGRQVYLVYQAPLRRVSLVEASNASGHPAFYCPMPGLIKDSALLSFPVFVAYLPIAFFHLARLIYRKKIDLVNCHYLSPYFIHLVIAARLLRVPVVVSVHGADIDRYRESDLACKLLLCLIMRGAHRIVACSEALARQTIEIFPDVRLKVTYAHNGVDLSHYASVPPTGARQGPFLLCVCRHVHKKGVDTLLQAFALVLRDVPTMSLVLVGGGPLLEEHQALARTLQIEHQVVFTGNLAHSQVSPFLAACTLFVLPSRAEPFGLVLLEAAYFRRGIVCTRVGGIPEIITNGVNGVLVEPDDPGSMAAQIVCLVRDGKRRELLGRQAYQTLVTRFLWKDRIHDYIAIYEGRLGAYRPGKTSGSGYRSDAGSQPADQHSPQDTTAG